MALTEKEKLYKIVLGEIYDHAGSGKTVITTEEPFIENYKADHYFEVFIALIHEGYLEGKIINWKTYINQGKDGTWFVKLSKKGLDLLSIN